MTRHKRHIAAWIASFAVLLASLAPSISHTLVAAGFSDANPVYLAALAGVPVPRSTPTMRHAPHMEGMDMEGMDMASTHMADMTGTEAAPSSASHLPAPNSPASHSPASHSPAMHFEHCPFCFTHAGTFGLLLTVSIVIPMSNASAIAPLLFYRAPQPLFAWSAAQPRAPPVPS